MSRLPLAACRALRRLALVLALLAAAPLAAQEAGPAGLEGPRAELQQIEAALGRPDLRDRDLEELKARVEPIREALRARIAEIEPRVAELEARLKELGKKPDGTGPPEDPAITAEREDVTKRFTAADGELKQARVIALRADQMAERIIERRRALFAAEVLARSDGILKPDFWLRAAAELPREVRSLRFLAGDWWSWVDSRAGFEALFGAVLTLIGAGLALLAGWRWLRRRHARRAPDADASRLSKALASWRALVASAAPPIAAAAAVFVVFDVQGLLPVRIEEVGTVVVLGVVLAAIARGVSLAVLAPDEPARRLVDIDDALAGRLHVLATWSARLFALAIALNALHKAVVAPVSLTLATSALMALAIAALLAATLFATRPAVDAEPEADSDAAAVESVVQQVSRGLQWLRALGWLIIVVLIGALVFGYIGLATFLSGRIVVAATLLGLVYLTIVLVDAVVAEGLASTTPRGRRVAGMLGLAPTSLDIVGALASGTLKLALFLVAAFVVLGPWGVHAVDVMSTFSGAFFGLQIGKLTISFTAMLGAVALLVAGLVGTRALQRWLELRLLPRTRLEPSLQNSVKQIVGYVGIIVAIMLALAQLGIDLQNIALVAGALSVGIGFGLQSIVSNFVSGLILLTERPIRVGDTINVGGEEGYVRRISVRATEIETFERSTVIVPNSQLITGVVKNWTHANTTGRVIIAVSTPYDVDPDQVRDILIDAACAHPQVLQTPAPRVFLLKFGDAALNFELRCVVSNVDYGLVVRSDLHFSILHRFRKAGILLPVAPPMPRPVEPPGAKGAAA